MAGEQRFFVTGLPRSRTAWCANFLSHGGAVCWHDGLANCASLDHFAAKLDAAPICGDSDSGLVFFHKALRERYPDAQWAVIWRDPEAVVASLLAMEPYPGIPAITSDAAWNVVSAGLLAMEEIASDPRVLSVPFSDLATRAGARALWWHCLRDAVPWDERRWDALRHMNVQVRSGEMAISLHAASQLFGRAA
jgi:hypothetical protein